VDSEILYTFAPLFPKGQYGYLQTDKKDKDKWN
jgi:hypothetical protein